MTELAYLVDISAGYVRSFRARVTALPPGAVVLDRTFFYPTGGGQPSDRGTLARASDPSVEVVDVTKSGSAVLHRFRPSAAVRGWAVGDELEGSLDWSRRYAHMRLHTSQHLLSARLFVGAGRRTRRANLGKGSATLDLDGPLSEGGLEEAVAGFRNAVARPCAVSIRQIRRVDWDRNPISERSGLVPLPPHVDPVRVVEIDGQDVCPCGGTHLRSTSEVGEVQFDPVETLTGGDARVRFTIREPGTPTPTG